MLTSTPRFLMLRLELTHKHNLNLNNTRMYTLYLDNRVLCNFCFVCKCTICNSRTDEKFHKLISCHIIEDLWIHV